MKKILSAFEAGLSWVFLSQKSDEPHRDLIEVIPQQTGLGAGTDDCAGATLLLIYLIKNGESGSLIGADGRALLFISLS